MAAGGGAASREAVFGVLSLILWALILIVTCKYVVVLLRADNNGEGGTLTLMALARRVSTHGATILYFGIIGAALFFGDALITPAISVLSAIEGVKVATPAFDHYVVPLTVLILVLLFAVQSRGTASVAAWLGPIMAVWFAVIGVAGLSHLLADPGVLAAFNPIYGVSFLMSHGVVGFVTLRCIPSGHRRGGALRRPGSFRSEADPGGLAGARAAEFVINLSRSGLASHAGGDFPMTAWQKAIDLAPLSPGNGVPAIADGRGIVHDPYGDRARRRLSRAGRSQAPLSASPIARRRLAAIRAVQPEPALELRQIPRLHLRRIPSGQGNKPRAGLPATAEWDWR